MGRGGDKSAKKSQVSDGSSLMYGPASPPKGRTTLTSLREAHPGIYAQLAKSGVKKVEVEFSGSGDEGWVEDGNFYDRQGNTIKGNKKLEEAVGKFVGEALNRHAEHWTSDDGSYGTATIDVDTGKTNVEWYVRSTVGESDSFIVVADPDLRKQLEESGIEKIEADFDGFADSGAVEEVRIVTEWQTIKAREDEKGNYQQIIGDFCDWIYRELSDARGGWEINDGSYGSITVSPDSEQAEFAFSWRGEDVSYEPFSFGQLQD